MENQIEQRTNEWHEQRKGKFTASEVYKLMGARGLGETGKTYAIEKAIDELFGITEERFVSYDMERGTTLEPLAFNKIKELFDLDFIDVTNCGFFTKDENSGSSPDGLIGSDGILEIKCPRTETFFKVVATDEIDSKYFYQMQKQMDDTNRTYAIFFNYCIIDGEEFWHQIRLERCQETIDQINERITEAVEIKNKFINQINTNKQWS